MNVGESSCHQTCFQVEYCRSSKQDYSCPEVFIILSCFLDTNIFYIHCFVFCNHMKLISEEIKTCVFETQTNCFGSFLLVLLLFRVISNINVFSSRAVIGRSFQMKKKTIVRQKRKVLKFETLKFN